MDSAELKSNQIENVDENIINKEEKKEPKPLKIIFAGPPRSGKSCLRQGIKDAMRAIPEASYPYVITACPDGEGAWFQETVNADPELAKKCKDAYKAKFTPEFVKRIADSVANIKLPLTFIDIGGITSKENEEICKDATHAILLAGDWQDKNYKERLGEWEVFCKKLGIEILAEIYSDYNGQEDKILEKDTDGVYRGSVHHLERGEPVGERPTIKELAKIIADIVKTENKL